MKRVPSHPLHLLRQLRENRAQQFCFIILPFLLGCSLDSRIQDFLKGSSEEPTQPSIQVLTPAQNSDNVKSSSATINLSGTCSEEGQLITLTPAATNPVTCISGNWNATLDLADYADSSLQVSVSISNLNGQSTTVQHGLNIYNSQMKKIVTGLLGFNVAVLTVNKTVRAGSIFTYDTGTIPDPLVEVATDVIDMVAAYDKFVILKEDSSVYSMEYLGGNPPSFISSDVTKLFHTGRAFAAIKRDGSVISWGEEDSGGAMGGSGGSDTYAWSGAPTEVTDANSDVVDIFTNHVVPNDFAPGDVFVALKKDGSIVSWGNLMRGGAMSGGDATWSSVPESIKTPPPGVKVTRIFFNDRAFVALKSDGSLVSWGTAESGGSMGTDGGAGLGAWTGAPASVTAPNSGVIDVFNTNLAFAALKQDGSIVTWGHTLYGGTMGGSGGSDSSAWFGAPSKVTSPSCGVKKVLGSREAFAAICADGSVVSWGKALGGGAMGGSGGSGYSEWAGAPAIVTSANSNVVDLYHNGSAFVARKADGSLAAWGQLETGGAMSDSSSWTGVPVSVTAPHSNVKKVIGNDRLSFSALKADGSVVTWGMSERGDMGGAYGAPTSVTDPNSGVIKVLHNGYITVALKADGSLLSWGGYPWNIHAPAELNAPGAVVDVWGNGRSFVAIKTDGTIVAWGRDEL